MWARPRLECQSSLSCAPSLFGSRPRSRTRQRERQVGREINKWSVFVGEPTHAETRLLAATGFGGLKALEREGVASNKRRLTEEAGRDYAGDE